MRVDVAGPASRNMTYAGFWPRAVAQLIDALALTPLIVLYLHFFHGYSSTVAIGAFIAIGALGFGYRLYFHARWGQTIGKMFARIRVVQLEGQPLGLRHAVARSSVDIVTLLTFAALLLASRADLSTPDWASLSWREHTRLLRSLPYFTRVTDSVGLWGWGELITLLMNRKRRTIHDFIGGSVVIKISGPTRTGRNSRDTCHDDRRCHRGDVGPDYASHVSLRPRGE